ncbi:unnamed protein product, partial [Prorocentrum cordatum]
RRQACARWRRRARGQKMAWGRPAPVPAWGPQMEPFPWGRRALDVVCRNGRADGVGVVCRRAAGKGGHQAHRGLAGAPLLRAAAEHRPLMGFAEQSPVRLVWPDSGRGNGTGRELLHLRRFRPQSLGATRTLYCGASSQK